MKKSMAKVLASALSLAMAVTLVTPTDAAAASAPKFVKTYGKLYSNAVYSVKNVKKGYKVKVSVSGTAKSAVTPTKKGAKVSTIKATGSTVKFTAAVKASEATAGKGATVKVVVYNTKGKKVKTLSDGIRVMAHTTAVSVSAAATKTAINQPVDLTATLTPSYATDEVTYTVDPADGASVTDGKFVATKEGTYKVTATSNGRTSEPVEIVVKNGIVSATQTSANSFKAVFAADASKTVSTGSITVKANDTAKTELQVKNVTFSTDGKEAEVTLLNNLTDKTAYTVTANGETAEFTASVGAVAKIAIETAAAELNTATDVKFKLFDANGIDVTSAVNVDAKCYMTVEGDYADKSMDIPSKAKITFSEVGQKATVKVVYNSNEKDAVDVVGTQEITCVAASAKTGSAVFARTSDGEKINSRSNCAKFYLGLSDENVKVAVGEEADDVYFCAKDESGKVISYDSYEVESSNDNVATATLGSADNGKYAKLSVSGGEKGSATLKITATKNNASTYYTIPVTVTETGKAVKMELSQDYSNMTNADDEEYLNTIKAELKDANNNTVKGSFVVKVVGNPENSDDYDELQPIGSAATDEVGYVDSINKNADGKYEADLCFAKVTKKKTFTVWVKGSDLNSDAEIARSVSVTVDPLPIDATKVEYTVEVNKKLDLNPLDRDDETATVKLKATAGGKFAGYYGNDKATTTGANDITQGKCNGSTLLDRYIVKSATAIVKYGSQEFETNPNNGLVRPAVGSATGATVPATFNAVISTGTAVGFAQVDSDADDVYAYNVTGLDAGTPEYANAGFAKTGSYTAQITVTYSDGDTNSNNTGATTEKKTAAFSITNSMKMPTVDVSTTSVSSYGKLVEEALTTNVDMNHEDEFASIQDVKKAKYVSAMPDANNKVIVKYVEVADNYKTTTAGKDRAIYHFMVPLSRTFTIK